MRILQTAKAAGVDVLLNPAPAVELEDEAYQAITHLGMFLSQGNFLHPLCRKKYLPDRKKGTDSPTVLNETEAAILTGRDLKEVEAEGTIFFHFSFILH